MGAHASGSFPEDVRASLDAFRRIVQAMRTSARDTERRVGLSGAQLFALQQLAASPGVSVNELAERTFTHQSSVSVVVQRLVKRRLVAKVPSREDRRRVNLAVTEAGRRILRRSPEPIQERLIAGIAALNDRERQTLAYSLNEIAVTMGANGHPPTMLFEEDRQRTTRRRRRPRATARK